MDNLLNICLILCPLLFLAGFVDSVAGGGGLISLPAYLLVGFPAHIAAGTNKVTACLGTSVSVIKYAKGGKIRFDIALFAAAGALVGSSIGTNAVVYLLSDLMLKRLMLIALPIVAVFLAVQKKFGSEDNSEKEMSRTKRSVLSVVIGLCIGCYDGAVGPGTGTFMIMAYTAVLGLDLLTSSGCAKVSNLASNVASAIIFLLHGQVMLAVVIPGALSNMLGNYMGTRYAMRGGSAKVKNMIYVVLALLFVKMAAGLVM